MEAVTTTTVCETSNGTRYVEVDGNRYVSDANELPSVGTEVEVDTYTGIGDVYLADARWRDDTPSGWAWGTTLTRDF